MNENNQTAEEIKVEKVNSVTQKNEQGPNVSEIETKKTSLFRIFRPTLIALGLFALLNQAVRWIPHNWLAEANVTNNDLRISDSCNTFPSAFYFQQLVRDIGKDPNYTIVFLGDSTVDSHQLKQEDSFRTHIETALEPLEETLDRPISVYVLARCKGMSKDFYYMVKKMVEMGVKPDLLVFNVPAYHFHLELKNHTTAEGFNDMVIKDFVFDESEQESMEELGLNTDEIKKQVRLEQYLPLYAFRKDLSAMIFGCHPRDYFYSKVDDEIGCESLPSNEDVNYYTYWKDLDPLKDQKMPTKADYVSKDDLFDDKFIFGRYYKKLAGLIEDEDIQAIAFVSPINKVFYNGRWLSEVHQDKKEIVEALSVMHGIKYLDLEEDIDEKYFGDKHHLNAEGTKAFAELFSANIINSLTP